MKHVFVELEALRFRYVFWWGSRMSDSAANEGFLSRWGRRITGLRNFILNFGFVLLIAFMVGALFSRPDTPSIEPNSALFLVPSGTLVEEVIPPNDWRDFLFTSADNGLIEVADVQRSIDLAANDDRISMLVLKLDQLGGLTPSIAITIGERLQAFRETGKKVIAYTEYSGQTQYLAASYADEIFLHPMGSIMLTGLGGDRLYFAKLLEKLKVTMHIFRVGEYKSAVEPYSRNDMSPAAKQDSARLLDGIWNAMTATIASNRGLGVDAILQFSNEYDRLIAATSGDGAKATYDSGLVDGLMTKNEFRQTIGNTVGWQEDRLNGIDFQSYLAFQSPLDGTDFGADKPVIGVLTVQGNIVESGVAGATMANAEFLVEQIRAAKENERVEALVLRVDSPGGSAFASELIREELESLQAAGKPVVASFGSVAASGGYWIAAGANAIFAEPTTITGSIGIFGLVPNFSRSLNAIGVTADGVGSAPLARGLSVVGELSEQAQTIIQLTIDHGYSQFIDLVASGRNMSKEAVEEIAQGRIWSGATAQEIGLVDQLGDLQTAIEHAATLAALDDYTSERIRPPIDPRSQIIMELMQASSPRVGDVWFDQLGQKLPVLGQLQDELDVLSTFQDPRYVYAMCLDCASP